MDLEGFIQIMPFVRSIDSIDPGAVGSPEARTVRPVGGDGNAHDGGPLRCQGRERDGWMDVSLYIAWLT